MSIRKIMICLVLFINNISVHAQSKKIENLVFEGAGIRGIAYCGVLQILEERDIMSGIKRVGGTSAGAITALLFAIGYTANEIEQIIFSTPFQKFNDGEYSIFGGAPLFETYSFAQRS